MRHMKRRRRRKRRNWMKKRMKMNLYVCFC